jgi:hypothetical protein
MKEFFKPTWKKGILAVILLFLLFYLEILNSSNWGCPLSNLSLPSIGNRSAPTPTPIPSLLDVMGKITITAVGLLVSPCPAYGEYLTVASSITLLILIIFSYMLSCLIVFLLRKLRRKNSLYDLKSKK